MVPDTEARVVRGTYAQACVQLEAWGRGVIASAPGGYFDAIFIQPHLPDEMTRAESLCSAPILTGGTLWYACGARRSHGIVMTRSC